MRCFIAVNCGAEVVSNISKVQERISKAGGIKLVESENIHLTLKFLWEITTSKKDEVAAALSDIRCPAFKVDVGGVGVFPGARKPSVIWAGLLTGVDAVKQLQSQVDDSLYPMGFEKDARFHPHITLARVKGKTEITQIADVLELEKGRSYGSFEASSFSLMESSLTPSGSKYSILSAYCLE